MYAHLSIARVSRVETESGGLEVEGVARDPKVNAGKEYDLMLRRKHN